MKNVYLDLKQETSENKLFAPAILVLLTIPLSYAYNSISVCVFTGITLVTFQKKNFKLHKSLLPFIGIYILMLLSLIWSLDFEKSSSSLVKELPLFAIPFCFFLSKPFTVHQTSKILKYYSLGMVVFALYYVIKAAIRFIITQDPSVFFYHELVSVDLNAIHVSIFMSVACFCFLSKGKKTKLDIFAIILLVAVVFMLASKNVIIVFLTLVFLYYFYFIKISNRIKYSITFGALLLLVSLSFVQQIRNRFLVEFKTNTTENTFAEGQGIESGKVLNVSVRQAWNNKIFAENYYFPGTAFRVYQIRIFLEMMREDPAFFTGYGLSASHVKIEEKAKQYKIHPGYAKYNFHNQYIQNFAELGIFAFLLLLILLFINIKNAFGTKNFVHIAFAILMVMLFLTESFLWRQRGVVYFAMMYCLLNVQSSSKDVKK